MDAVLRKLARDQWVRFHGTPRITVLVGGARARALWTQWAALAAPDALLLEGAFEARIREAAHAVTTAPARAVAVLVDAASLAAWRRGRDDRLAALVDEGTLVIADGAPDAAVGGAHAGAAPFQLDARSAAEAALFEALEATPQTAGKFELNGNLSVRFGSRAAEIDLLARGARIAIEIDGIHHFADPECYRRDRRKDLLMQKQGLFVIRLLAEDVLRDARASVSVVCEVLAHQQRA